MRRMNERTPTVVVCGLLVLVLVGVAGRTLPASPHAGKVLGQQGKNFDFNQDVSYHAMREAYAYVNTRHSSQFDVGGYELVKDPSVLQDMESESDSDIPDDLGRSWESDEPDSEEWQKRRGPPTLRLLVIDTIPSVMLPEFNGPSIHVDMRVKVIQMACMLFRHLPNRSSDICVLFKGNHLFYHTIMTLVFVTLLSSKCRPTKTHR